MDLNINLSGLNSGLAHLNVLIIKLKKLAIISTQVTYESDHISLLRDSTMPSALNFVFYVFYCNVKEKYIRRTINSKKRNVYI